MRINSDFKIRNVAGETIVVNQGAGGADLTRIISLNASACLLWEELASRTFSIEDAAEVLIKNYGIDAQRAEKDAISWVQSLKSCGVIED